MMTSFFTYIIESAVSVSIFYIFYEVFLKRDTWFRFNRYFLLFGLIFSILVPILDFSASQFVVNSQNQFEMNEFLSLGSTVSSFEVQTVNYATNAFYVFLFYLIVAGIFSFRFIQQLILIIKTIHANEIIKYNNFRIVLIDKKSSPFSFFNYIFIHKDDYGPDSYLDGSKELLLHEITHAKQKHTIDLILLEIILVLQWFNPFMYRFRQAFKEVHEYLADRGVIMENADKIAYQKLIISQIEKGFYLNLASHFNYSITKNRIKMITRIKSRKITQIKFLLIVPIAITLLMAFTIETNNNLVDKTTLAQINIKSDNSITAPSIFPVKKVDGVKISSGYGMRKHPITKEEKMHNGVDIIAPEGTPVYATALGKVRFVEQNFKEGEGRGRYIIIDHDNGFSTLYSQLSGYNITEGKQIKQGDIIGYVGSSGLSTGPHLHYEVMKDGVNVNPEDYF